MTSAKIGQRTDQPSGEYDSRQSTRTSLLREPELVSVEQIRPTNKAIIEDGRRIKYSPICLVEHNDGFFYIVDGNHRYYKKVMFEKEFPKIPAWILREGDQNRLVGNPIPSILAMWKVGRITLEKLGNMAQFESRKVNFSLVQAPPTQTGGKDKTIKPNHISQTRINSEWPTHKKFALVIELIKNEISIKMASKKYSLPIDTIEDWQHRSLQAIRDALED